MLPEMLVIRKRQIIPIHKTDGEAIMRIAPCNLEEETSMLEVELDTAPTPGAVIKLFLADDAFYDTQGGYVRIQDPPIDKLKLTR